MNWENYSDLNLPVVMSYDDRYEQTSWEELDGLCSNGDPIALYEKANRYRLGEGIEKNIDQAMLYYEQVLKYQKHTRALYFMGGMFLEDIKSADCEKCFRLGSALGDADCSREMGELYRYGDYVDENPEKAIYFFKLSAEQGNTNSLVSAGEVCLDEQNYDRAFEYFTTAYQSDDPVAAYYIGKMYYYGTGVEESDEKAFPYLKMASDKDFRPANVMLASLYGFGNGTRKDVQLAMKLLDDVDEDEIAWSYNIKGRILITEGNNEEGRIWLQKSAEMGNEDAKKLLDNGVGKTDEELANEGSDPYAMIRYSAKLMGNKDGQKPDIHKALEVITKANQLFPDNIDVKQQYIIMLHLFGHIDYKIGATQEAYNTLRQCFNELTAIRNKNVNAERLNAIEADLYMDYGEAAYGIKNYDVALNMFSLTDRNKYPYAVVLSMLMHMDDPRRFGAEIADEASFLIRATSSDKWREPVELAGAYFMLSCVYSTGIPNYVNADVNYAYACIQKCSEIDSEMAASELRKYSKNLFGKVTYRY